jgi:hypothetical protein
MAFWRVRLIKRLANSQPNCLAFKAVITGLLWLFCAGDNYFLRFWLWSMSLLMIWSYVSPFLPISISLSRVFVSNWIVVIPLLLGIFFAPLYIVKNYYYRNYLKAWC